MEWSVLFFLNSALLRVGLAMDAFSVSMANGLNEPGMKTGKILSVAGVFGFFQALMPLAGWLCVHTVVKYFEAFEKFVPWIAFVLLGFIGGKMLYDGIKGGDSDEKKPGVGLGALLVQGVATSIDALSTGFTIADYGFVMALVAALIMTNRILGFINAPALAQKIIMRCTDAQVDLSVYRSRRDAIAEFLDYAGIEYTLPRGAFYFFPKSPVEDENIFINALLNERVLGVAGRSFGLPGYFRLAFFVNYKTIRDSADSFKRAVAAVAAR